jgi:hypothetical protein
MLQGMDPQEEPNPIIVDSLRERLRTLATASNLPVPPLVVDAPRQQERPPHVREVAGVRSVVVPRSLIDANPDRQLYELAACLGREASPVPAQRRRIGGIVLVVLLVALVVLIFLRPASWIWITPILLYPVGAGLLRWERRAMDDAGRAILAAAGHRPAEVARDAFGQETDQPGLKGILSGEPSPSSRLRAAEADRRNDPTA